MLRTRIQKIINVMRGRLRPSLEVHSLPRPRYPELDAIVLEDDPAAALASEDSAIPRKAANGIQLRHGSPVAVFGGVPLPAPIAW